MRVLVCGGRLYSDQRSVVTALADLHSATPISAVIHGGAKGADDIGAQWARRAGIETVAYLPDWRANGPAAGPMRNQRMLDDGSPDLVVAFPGGRGTADMVRRASRAGVRVIQPLANTVHE